MNATMKWNLAVSMWHEKIALAGNRTQIYCLEGSNANHYTTNALLNNNTTDEALVVYINILILKTKQLITLIQHTLILYL